MKKRITVFLAVIALLSIITAGIGKANAYFTTYARALGGRTIELGDETTIEEKYEPFKKTLVISNSDTSNQAVYVRAQAFGGSEYLLDTAGSDSKWREARGDEDPGFYYYDDVVLPGGKTGELIVSILDKETGKQPVADKDKTFNIVIVYETTPAVQNGNGKYEKADWNQEDGWTKNQSSVSS